MVHSVEKTYEKGVKVLSDELKYYQSFWQRSETLPKWDVTIIPTELVSFFLATLLAE